MAKDLAAIGLPFQIGGAAAIVLGLGIIHIDFEPGFWLAVAGTVAHLAGDTLFFFQMKRQGCL